MDSADVVCVFTIHTTDSQISFNKPAVRHFDPLREPVAISPHVRFGGSARSCLRYRYGRAIVGKALDLLRIVFEGWGAKLSARFSSRVVAGSWRLHGIAKGSHYAKLGDSGGWRRPLAQICCLPPMPGPGSSFSPNDLLALERQRRVASPSHPPLAPPLPN